jgi:putative chitinase
MHESGDLAYDRELWGPTPAQKRYDTRTDLGNTPEADGDGYGNRGMGPIQLTGAGNRRAFREWCIAEGFDPPEFVGTDALLADPWEGLSAVWYWTSRNLNRCADAGDFENITWRINGGTNGFDDRAPAATPAPPSSCSDMGLTTSGRSRAGRG